MEKIKKLEGTQFSPQQMSAGCWSIEGRRRCEGIQGDVSLVAQRGKNPPAMRETRVPSLGGEDPLEKGKTTHSCILAWRIPWTEEPGGLSS